MSCAAGRDPTVTEDQTMGHWGVKSFENDIAADALDAGMDRVHGSTYEDLMDDGNPLTVDQVQARLADPRTLVASLGALEAEHGPDSDAWDDPARLAYAGVVVRHAELGVAVDPSIRARAANLLEAEAIDWDEATARKLRKQKEIALLRRDLPGGG